MTPLAAFTGFTTLPCPHPRTLSLSFELSSFILRRSRFTQCRASTPNASSYPHPHQDLDSCVGLSETRGRREAMLQMIVASSALSLLSEAILPINSPAYAANEDLRTYADETNKYKIAIPNDWQVGSGETDGVRSLTVFYPEKASSSNVSILITGLGPDFTRLESFGKVDEFAETLVSGLDRSWQRPAGVAAKLLDSKASKGLYYIEYTLQMPGESRRHIYSALGVANTGWYNRLYTITGQYLEEEADMYRTEIEKAVRSFRFVS